VRIHADVVDISATPFLPVYAAWLASRLSRTPLVATWHEYWGEHWQTYLAGRRGIARLARAGEATARPLADRRVAVSTFTANRLTQASGAARRGLDDIDVVPNGVDLGSLLAAGSTRPSERPVDVAFVGRLIAEKRVNLLVRAIAELVERRPEIRCEIIGDGPEQGSIATLVQELGLSRQITLSGRVSEAELPGRLGSARIVAMPSAREGYGITVVEGQAVGAVPVVAQSPLSAAPDLIDNGVDGLVVDSSPEAFASAIGRLLDDPAELERLSSAARNTAATRGWNDRAADMERVYVAVAAGRRRKARTGGRKRAAELLHRAART
jgi:glycosyltransferase involved in cell wall biosynthesis